MIHPNTGDRRSTGRRIVTTLLLLAVIGTVIGGALTGVATADTPETAAVSVSGAQMLSTVGADSVVALLPPVNCWVKSYDPPDLVS